MERTKTPGVFKRGSKFVVPYRCDGKQHKPAFPTEREAKLFKARLQLNGAVLPESSIKLWSYIDEWVEQYQGIRENTRNDYRSSLKLAKEFFPYRLKLTQVTPKHIADYIAWLIEKQMKPSSIRKTLAPLGVMFRTSMEQGLRQTNPTLGMRIPKPIAVPTEDDHEDEAVKVFTREQLACVLATVRQPLLFELLACSGLRISEALALEWRHLELNGSAHVKVRRGLVRGKIGPPKSRYGRREVSLPFSIVRALRRHERGPSELVFPSQADTYLKSGNIRERVLQPALDEAGCAWAGFHTFRHTYASMQLARGVNIVALSRAMGHHSAAFTLTVYGHLLEGDEAPALELSRETELATDGIMTFGSDTESRHKSRMPLG